mmetsp:Transcript_14870/g.27498  ORF Transcript_14870/g.27498 Transcript_14870/m.27498 type:complete len:178 (-) Transcript_14870:852-1385(-)
MIKLVLPALELPLVRFVQKEIDYTILNNLSLESLFTGRNLLIGIPGAFFPSVQYKFLPEYLDLITELKWLGKLSHTFVVSVNDPYVLKEFAEEIDAESEISYLADFNGELTKALQATLTLPTFGERCQYFRALVENGEVQSLINSTDWALTDKVRAHRLLWEFSGHEAYPDGVYESS